jgi:predicted DNA binding CopG/RHH family protein
MKNSHRLSDEKLFKLYEEAEQDRGKKTPSRLLTREESEKIREKIGLQSINIRLPSTVIQELKTLATAEGLKYQPYVRRLLVQHVKLKSNVTLIDELRSEIRSIVREELKKASGE